MSIAAGWYADPSGPGSVRWWDGASWTSTTAPMPPAAAPAPTWTPPVAPAPSVAASTGGRHLATATLDDPTPPRAPAAEVPAAAAPSAAYAASPTTAAPPAYGGTNAGWEPMDLLVPKARTLGTRALVWGIVAVVLPIALAPAVMALVFGAMGLDYNRRLRASGLPDQGRGRSIAGLVLGAVSPLLLVGAIVVFNLRG